MENNSPTSYHSYKDSLYDAAAAILKRGPQVETVISEETIEELVEDTESPAMRKTIDSLQKKGFKFNKFSSDNSVAYLTKKKGAMNFTAEVDKDGKVNDESLASYLDNISEDTIEESADTADIKKVVDKLKVGDKTNLGVVTDIGSDSVTFKAKDTPVTKIKFGQYKIGSRDLVLSNLKKLSEDTEEDLDEAIDKITAAREALKNHTALLAKARTEKNQKAVQYHTDAIASAKKTLAPKAKTEDLDEAVDFSHAESEIFNSIEALGDLLDPSGKYGKYVIKTLGAAAVKKQLTEAYDCINKIGLIMENIGNDLDEVR